MDRFYVVKIDHFVTLKAAHVHVSGHAVGAQELSAVGAPSHGLLVRLAACTLETHLLNVEHVELILHHVVVVERVHTASTAQMSLLLTLRTLERVRRYRIAAIAYQANTQTRLAERVQTTEQLGLMESLFAQHAVRIHFSRRRVDRVTVLSRIGEARAGTRRRRRLAA